MNPLHSFHAFLFPFKWKRNLDNKHPTLEEQTSLDGIRDLMKKAVDDWELTPPWDEPKTLAQYNEANYFYDFARPVLYGDAEGKFQTHYSHKKAKGTTYQIALNDGAIYSLEIDDIGVSFYNMGVGVLTIHCYNREYSDPTDILKINQYGRRLYPPFLGTDADKTGTQAFFDDNNWVSGIEKSQSAELPKALIISKGENQTIAVDNFSDYRKQPELDKIPGLIAQLLPKGFSENTKLTPVLDDRMFVVCWYGNDELAAAVKDFNNKSDERDWWYKFIFVDVKWPSVSNEAMLQQQLDAHTYKRWHDVYTLYGVCRYSFVSLTSSLATLKKYNASFIIPHMQTMYFKLVELVLVQRACVLRFSDEVADIGDMKRKDPTLAKRASSLTRRFIRFINKVYFREVTAQEQGIELYDMLQTHLRIEKQVQDLDKEIQELHQYVSLEEEKARNEKLDILTYLASAFIAPSFICTYLGIEGFDMENHIPCISTICVISALLTFAIVLSRGRFKRFSWFFLVVGILFMLYTLFVFPCSKF